ncbi:hypothetical protein [Streptomyces sp. NPDC001340]
MADRAHSHAWSPQQMSSGEQQRTGIAVALANHHELVLADYPSASSTPRPPRRSSQPCALPTKISTPRSSWSPTHDMSTALADSNSPATSRRLSTSATKSCPNGSRPPRGETDRSARGTQTSRTARRRR